MKRNGFTLIELIVVIAILAIIAAVAVPTAFGSIENARLAACNANKNSIFSEYRLELADKLLNEGKSAVTDAEKLDLLTSAYAALGNATCPSSSEAYTLDATDGVLTITCPFHGKTGEGETPPDPGTPETPPTTPTTATVPDKQILADTQTLFGEIPDLKDASSDNGRVVNIPSSSELISKLNERLTEKISIADGQTLSAILQNPSTKYDKASNGVAALIYKANAASTSGGYNYYVYFNGKIYGTNTDISGNLTGNKNDTATDILNKLVSRNNKLTELS